MLSLLLFAITATMLTSISSQTFERSEKRPLRSSASTETSVSNERFCFSTSHSTGRNLALSSGGSEMMFEQSALCTDTPLPFVIKPTISSPGTGLQHLASLMRGLSMPLMRIPPVASLFFFVGFACNNRRCHILSLLNNFGYSFLGFHLPPLFFNQ